MIPDTPLSPTTLKSIIKLILQYLQEKNILNSEHISEETTHILIRNIYLYLEKNLHFYISSYQEDDSSLYTSTSHNLPNTYTTHTHLTTEETSQFNLNEHNEQDHSLSEQEVKEIVKFLVQRDLT